MKETVDKCSTHGAMNCTICNPSSGRVSSAAREMAVSGVAAETECGCRGQFNRDGSKVTAEFAFCHPDHAERLWMAWDDIIGGRYVGSAFRPLNEIAAKIREINDENGWETPTDWLDDHHIPAKLALIHSEVSEALEAFRDEDYLNFKDELADILIRVLDLAHGLGVNMDQRVSDKMEKNKKRGYKHGGKRV